jgi:hypothetical protein
MLLSYWQYFIDLLDLKTVVSLASATLSATSLYFTRHFWLASNRPIISASIVSDEIGNVVTTYKLVIYNTGNRPATSIKLYADKEVIDKIIDPNADPALTDDIYKCFSNKPIIPLLINGKETSNSFGITSTRSKDNVLRYNSELPILISYSDLENRKYNSKQVLVVKISQGFAGQW